MPALVGDSAKVQPSNVRAVADLTRQLMTIQIAFEEFLEEREAVMRLHSIQTQARPRFWRAFNNECTRFSVDPIGVCPHPAAACADETVHKGLENPGCP